MVAINPPHPNHPGTYSCADSPGGETGYPGRRTHSHQRVPRELPTLRAGGMVAVVRADGVRLMALSLWECDAWNKSFDMSD